MAENQYTYSQAEMLQKARDFCNDQFGPVRESLDEDTWLMRFGFLCAFIFAVFPQAEGKGG